MGRYCTVDDVAARFRTISDVIGYPQAVDSHFILYAENELDTRLAPFFTVPFSSNNLTAKDISIDLTYAKSIQYEDPKKNKSINDLIDKKIDSLIGGGSSMLTTSGEVILPTNSNYDSYSSTESYHSAFGMGDFEDFSVSSAQLSAEWDER